MPNLTDLHKFIFPLNETTLSTLPVTSEESHLIFSLLQMGLPLPKSFLLYISPFNQEVNKSNNLRAMSLQEIIDFIEIETEQRFGSLNNPLLLKIKSCTTISQTPYPILKFLGLPLHGLPTINGISSIQSRVSEERENIMFSILHLEEIKNLTFSRQRNYKEVYLKLLESFLNIHISANLPERHSVKSTAFSFIIQEMKPSMLLPDDTILKVFSSDPVNPSKQPFGYMRVSPSTDFDKCTNLPLSNLLLQEQGHYSAICDYCKIIETLYRGVCLVEFGISLGELSILSIERTPATPEVIGRILVEQTFEGNLAREEVIKAVEPSWFEYNDVRDVTNRGSLVVWGFGDSLGKKTVTGRLAMSSETVNKFSEKYEPTIFVCEELGFEHTALMLKSEGAISMRGGITSHMIVMARGIGKACIILGNLASYSKTRRELTLNALTLTEGDWVTISEPEGLILIGCGEFTSQAPSRDLDRILSWSKSLTPLTILVNADNAEEAQKGVALGATGVGLCRSEHQLVDTNTLDAFRCMLLTQENMKREVFMNIVLSDLACSLIDMLKLLDGKIIHYRLLDAPLNEFISDDEETIERLAKRLDVTVDRVRDSVRQLKEKNSFLGWRGCRWGLAFHNFYQQQIKMIIDCVAEVISTGITVDITVVVPMVSLVSELEAVSTMFNDIISSSTHASIEVQPNFTIGVMIETPRATLISQELVKVASTICFGSNDLTQAVWAMSRDDSSKYFAIYSQLGLTNYDPFQIIDIEGVGQMIQSTIASVQSHKPRVKHYVCGEHASVLQNIPWLVHSGVDGISCSSNFIAPAIVASTKVYLAARDNDTYLPYKNRLYQYTEENLKLIVEAIGKGNRDKAVRLAYQWAITITPNLQLDVTNIWKFFKRNIAIKWFGSWEYKRFFSEWATDDVVHYATSLRNDTNTIRYSMFPYNIAAQSFSSILPTGQPVEVWKDLIDKLDHSVAVEVFPQQPKHHLSFRAVFHDSSLRVEAGIGQAIDVFWQERGKHEVVTGTIDGRMQEIKYDVPDSIGADVSLILSKLKQLIQHHGWQLMYDSQDICQSFGLAWVALEGYFDSETLLPPRIVDVDLPMDIAFYGTRNQDMS